jgi:hypothetical protein
MLTFLIIILLAMAVFVAGVLCWPLVAERLRERRRRARRKRLRHR